MCSSFSISISSTFLAVALIQIVCDAEKRLRFRQIQRPLCLMHDDPMYKNVQMDSVVLFL